MKVFISHSSKDREIAEALIQLLRLAFGLPSEDIRCTSVEGFRLPGGASTNATLRREVYGAETFIGLITANSIESVYVMFELGARWGSERNLVPVLAGGATTEQLKGPLSGINALNCSIPAQIHQLLDDVGRSLSLRVGSPSAYQKALDLLVASSTRQLAKTAASKSPSSGIPGDMQPGRIDVNEKLDTSKSRPEESAVSRPPRAFNMKNNLARIQYLGLGVILIVLALIALLFWVTHGALYPAHWTSLYVAVALISGLAFWLFAPGSSGEYSNRSFGIRLGGGAAVGAAFMLLAQLLTPEVPVITVPGTVKYLQGNDLRAVW